MSNNHSLERSQTRRNNNLLSRAKIHFKKMSSLWIFAIISISVANATETHKLICHENAGTQDGRTANYSYASPSLWKEEGSSFEAAKGAWILYEKVDYKGDTMLVTEGETINANDIYGTNNYISARPVTSALIVYEKKKNEKDGKKIVLGQATPNFKLLDWVNDEASSVEAVIGTWELYENINYEGNRMIVAGSGRINVVKNDYYSSARPICTYQNDPTTAKLRVFENKNQQPPEKDFVLDQANLAELDGNENWKDKISSIQVLAGDWELYKNENYEGDRIVVRAGERKNVKNDHYSSLRPICELYSPTPSKCNITGTTVLNNENKAQKDNDGTQIVGIIVDSSCAGVAKGHMNMDRTDSVEESFSVETGKDDEINWSASVSVSVGFETGMLGFGASSEVSAEVGAGGSHTFSSSKTTETTNGYSQSLGFELEYPTPAVAVLFGSVDKYTIAASDVPIIKHMECPDGPRNKNSTASLTATTYQSADYWYLIKDLTQDDCDANYETIQTCMQQFKEKYSKKFAAKKTVKASFDACFKFTTNAATEAPVYKVQLV